MAEIVLIEIVWSTKEDGIDFNVKAVHDDIMKRHKTELLEMLETLVARLRSNQYPFHFERGEAQ